MDYPSDSDKDPKQVEKLLEKLQEEESVIPDELIEHILDKAGVPPEDKALTRLLAFAVEKSIHDTALASMNETRNRGDTTLTLEDLQVGLRQAGVDINPLQYIADPDPEDAPKKHQKASTILKLRLKPKRTLKKRRERTKTKSNSKIKNRKRQIT